ncbi:hypothetical protein ABBQ38_012203 [Trebouxia sp. C0009 RCD-2024]
MLWRLPCSSRCFWRNGSDSCAAWIRKGLPGVTHWGAHPPPAMEGESFGSAEQRCVSPTLLHCAPPPLQVIIQKQ